MEGKKQHESSAADTPSGLGLRVLPRVRLVRTPAEPHPYREPVRQAIDVYRLVGGDVSAWDREHFCALLLDSRSRIIGLEEVAVGTLTAALVHPRELFKAAILANAHSLVIVHNHPSGDPEPSTEDIALTKRLVEAGELLGITVIDHVVIGDGRYQSFSELGRI
jgi:DNA repair protein RadC